MVICQAAQGKYKLYLSNESRLKPIIVDEIQNEFRSKDGLYRVSGRKNGEVKWIVYHNVLQIREYRDLQFNSDKNPSHNVGEGDPWSVPARKTEGNNSASFEARHHDNSYPSNYFDDDNSQNFNYSVASVDMRNSTEPFNGVIFCFLFFGMFFFWSMANLAGKEGFKKLGWTGTIICLISLPIYLYPYFYDIIYGVAAGFVGLTVIFGWAFIILVICFLCSIFIK